MATTTKATAAKTEKIDLLPLKKKQVQITLVGDTPLIVHRFSEKAKREMLEKQQKKAKTSKGIRDPEAEYRDSMYEYPGGGYGFPSIAFKAAAVSAANDSGMKMTVARRAFHIMDELVKIDGEPRMREDIVKLGGPSNPADLRYRGEFREWKVTIDITYNEAVISMEQIVNLFQTAGFGIGIGEWRAQRNGSNGLFHVATEGEI